MDRAAEVVAGEEVGAAEAVTVAVDVVTRGTGVVVVLEPARVSDAERVDAEDGEGVLVIALVRGAVDEFGRDVEEWCSTIHMMRKAMRTIMTNRAAGRMRAKVRPLALGAGAVAR